MTTLTARTQLRLEEWRGALDNARHFNDLLIRMRAFGIPIVVTVMGAGLGFATSVSLGPVSVMWASVVTLVLAMLLPIYVALFFRSECDSLRPTWVEWVEMAILEGVLVAALVFTASRYGTVMFGNGAQITFPVSMAVALFGLALLCGLYVMDRYYYFNLLVAAVTRARALECELEFSLTKTISDLTPIFAAKNVITTIYFLPAFGIIVTILVLGYMDLWRIVVPGP